MIYLKSVLFGVGGAVLASVLWITATFIVPIFLPYIVARGRRTGTGGGSFYVGGGDSSGYVGSGSILIAALIGFIIAFAWAWHRLRAA
jgi:hypothetical protein